MYSACYFAIYLYASNERVCAAHAIFVFIYMRATDEHVQRILFWHLSICERQKSMCSACYFGNFLYVSNQRACAAHVILVYFYKRAAKEHVQRTLFWYLSICEERKSMCSACYFGNFLYASNQRACAAHVILIFIYMRTKKERIQRMLFWYLSICEERKSMCSACYFGNYLYASNERACTAHAIWVFLYASNERACTSYVILVFIYMLATKERVQRMLFWYLSICKQRKSVYSACYFGIYLYSSNERA